MKKIFLVFFLLLMTLNTQSQEPSVEDSLEQLTEEDEIIDGILEEEEVDSFLKSVTKFKFLHLSIDYNTNTYFSGRDIGVNQFNSNPQITYLHSNGFFAGISGVFFEQFTPQWDYTSATLGFAQKTGKSETFGWSASYTRYFFTNASEENTLENTISLGIDLENKKKTLGTELTTAYLFGSDDSFQITLSTYGVISLSKKTNSHLKLRPELQIIAAEQTIQLSQIITVRDREFTRYILNNDFGLMNTQLLIPLQYSTGNIDFELGYIVNFPTSLSGESALKATDLFNFSISYLFDL
ncbi:MAG: hypothetical protein ACPGU6_01775 [Tenacibaculum sp.]